MRIILMIIGLIILGSLATSVGLLIAVRSGGDAAATSKELIRSSINALYLVSEPKMKDQTAKTAPNRRGPMPDK
jgi:hypothetical protein